LIDAQPIARTAHMLHIPSIADIQFFPERQTSQRGVGGIEISPHAKMRKILKNAMLEGAQQLATGVPGVIVVHSDFAPPHALADAVLNAANRSDPWLQQSTAYVVIFSNIDPPIVWQNPSLADDPVSKALTADLYAIFADVRSPQGSESSRSGRS
jgi:hypothetical protein